VTKLKSHGLRQGKQTERAFDVYKFSAVGQRNYHIARQSKTSRQTSADLIYSGLAAKLRQVPRDGNFSRTACHRQTPCPFADCAKLIPTSVVSALQTAASRAHIEESRLGQAP